MSIQINGIDKPKSCFDCPCIDNEFEECAAREHYLLPKDEYGAVLGEVPDWCPITEPPTCEDAVSRQAALDIAYKYCPDDDGVCSKAGCDPREMLDEIEALPPAQPTVHPQRTCVNCSRTVNNGGWYADGRTRCPIEEHYALPKDGYCHLWEKRNVTDDDYPERREE